MPSPSTDVHTYTHTCTHTHMYSSWWCASSPASLQPCNLASVWFYHRWRVFKTEMPLPFAFSSFFSIDDFVWNIYCGFCGMTFQGGNVCSCEPAFCLNMPCFSCLILYYDMGWAQPSLIPLWLRSPLCLVGCKPRAAPRLFCLCWKTKFLFSFVLLEGLSAASCNFVWSGFWGMGNVPGLCGQGGHQGRFWSVNLHVQVAADHSASLLQDSSAAALFFCPEKNCPKNFFGKEDEGSNPCLFQILWNHPVKPPCRSSVSGHLCEQQVLSQQIQIYRKTFVKCQAISS